MPIPSRTPFPRPGIYLSMPESQYRAVDALSKSLIRSFNRCPRDAWELIHGDEIHSGDESTGGGVCPATETSADLTFGAALHTLVLEGREAFDRRYARAFDKADHPDALDTIGDLRRWIADSGETPAGPRKKPLIEQALSIDPEVPIIERLRAAHQAAHAGREFLPAVHYDEILNCAALATDWDWGRHQAKFTHASFFWFDPELQCPCKARLDTLLCSDNRVVIWDLKSYANPHRKPLAQCVRDAINYERYFIDVALYRRAVRQTPNLVHDMAGVTKLPVASGAGIETGLLFVEKHAAHPHLVPVVVETESVIGSLTDVGIAADTAIRHAASQINRLRADDLRRGATSPWQTRHPMMVFGESDLIRR